MEKQNFSDNDTLNIVLMLINELYVVFENSKHRFNDEAQNTERLLNLLGIAKVLGHRFASYDIILPQPIFEKDIILPVGKGASKKEKKIDRIINNLEEAMFGLQFTPIDIRIANIIMIDMLSFIEIYASTLNLPFPTITLQKKMIETKIKISFSIN